MSNLSVLSLFSGCGGFDIGALSWGCLDVIWANDIDAAAAQAYKHMVPCGEFHHGDVQKVQSFPKADILIGCYPCTGFSMGARRRAKGMEERDLMSIKGNFLYQEFLRALDQANPKYFFVENVTGMVSAKMDGSSNNRNKDLMTRAILSMSEACLDLILDWLSQETVFSLLAYVKILPSTSYTQDLPSRMEKKVYPHTEP